MRISLSMVAAALLACAAPASAQDAAKTQGAEAQGELVSVDFNDMELKLALRTMAELMHINIVAAKGVEGRVTLRLRSVSAEAAFQTLLGLTGNRAERQRGVIIVYPIGDH